jgi:flagellar protein FlaG
MAVTRIDAPRPVQATQPIATAKPRQPANDHKHEEDRQHDAGAEEVSDRDALNFRPYALSFRYEKELKRVVVKVFDPETGELVREVPPESVIEALKQLRATAGRLVDAEA